jgi:hypothetical protein
MSKSTFGVRAKQWALLGLLVATFGVQAQGVIVDPDWKESEAPPAPTFNKDKLLALDMPKYVSLRFGIDPNTITITADGIVRYVVVSTNTSGSVNAIYEGIRCDLGEVKTYARTNSSGQWTAVKDPKWLALNDNHPSKHALAFARQGACDSRSTAASSVADIIKAMK